MQLPFTTRWCVCFTSIAIIPQVFAPQPMSCTPILLAGKPTEYACMFCDVRRDCYCGGRYCPDECLANERIERCGNTAAGQHYWKELQLSDHPRSLRCITLSKPSNVISYKERSGKFYPTSSQDDPDSDPSRSDAFCNDENAFQNWVEACRNVLIEDMKDMKRFLDLGMNPAIPVGSEPTSCSEDTLRGSDEQTEDMLNDGCNALAACLEGRVTYFPKDEDLRRKICSRLKPTFLKLLSMSKECGFNEHLQGNQLRRRLLLAVGNRREFPAGCRLTQRLDSAEAQGR